MTGYEQLAQAPLGDNILASIAQTARDVIQAQDDVVRAEEALKAAKAHLRTLEEEVLPELMKDAGQEKLTTIDGLMIEIKENVRGQPSKENEAAAFGWLRETGNGGVIKSQIIADLGKAPEEKVQAAVQALVALGIPTVSAKEGVHWQTLGSLVREKLAKGDKVPLDILGVQVWKAASVKPKKAK